jgi:type IV fimbrial biogenesis protein FimT
MKKYMRGFTLIELMVTIAIVAIMLTIAAPSMTGVLKKNRIESYQEDLLRDVGYARQEAVTRNIPVAVCKSADGATCTTGNDWEQGWIIFVDNPGTTAGSVDGGDEILRVHGAVAGGDRLEGSEHYLQFDGRGWLQLSSGNTDVTLTACSDDDEYIRGMLILSSGRALASRVDGNGDSYVKTGAALACS